MFAFPLIPKNNSRKSMTLYMLSLYNINTMEPRSALYGSLKCYSEWFLPLHIEIQSRGDHARFAQICLFKRKGCCALLGSSAVISCIYMYEIY